MTWEYTRTREEETYLDLYEEEWDTWSGAVRAVFMKVGAAADKEYMYNYFVEERGRDIKHYDVVTDEMRLAAAQLTDREREMLRKHARAALVAAASIDPDEDDQIWSEFSVYPHYEPNRHHLYRLESGMLWAILNESRQQAELPE
jgi:hypothetical protein